MEAQELGKDGQPVTFAEQRENDIASLALYWELTTKFPAPEYRYLNGWLRSAPLEELLEIVDHVAGQVKARRVDNAEHAGRIVSSTLRRKRDASESRGVLRLQEQ
jgi:hypothetical protein